MKNTNWHMLKLVSFTALGNILVLGAQCTILNTCLQSCIINLREACKVGCSSVEGAYEEEVLENTNLPTAPFASSIGSHSVTLLWKSANISEVKYIIQWKYAQLPGRWIYAETVSRISCMVRALRPFTEYVFRVVWIFTAQMRLSSPTSPRYRTHPHGVPQTAPLIRNIESSGPDTVEVSWTPPQFPGGPILGYNLRLISKNNKFDSGTQRTSFQFYSTLPNTTYRFFVVAVNEAGEGPEAESGLLFGISAHVDRQVVYFSEGTLIWMKEAARMSNVSDLRVFYRGSGLISSISTDWLYQRMYFIMNDLVYVCDLEICSNFEEITPASIIAPQKLVADAYNGYIFYLLRDGIYRVDLPGPSVRDAKPVRIVESCTLKDFAIKPQSKRIIYFNDTSQVFMSTFLDGSASCPVLSQFPFADVQSFACENNDFLVTDGKAIFRQDSMSFNEFIVGCDLSHVEEFGFGNLVIFSSSVQPHPVPHHPRDISVLFGSHQALVQWKPPALPIGASPSAWQNWTYEVQIQRQSVLTGHSDMVTHVKLLVNDMAVDSVGGYLYWTTLHSVESTRLNGESALVLQAQPWLSGKKGARQQLGQRQQGRVLRPVCPARPVPFHLQLGSVCFRSTVDISITEFAAWSTSEISQNALMYYSGRLFWINGFRMITAQEIGQRTSVSVSEAARFSHFTIIQTSLKPLPGNFSSTPKVILDSVPESSFRTEGNASAFQVLWSTPPKVDWGVVFYSVEFSAHSKFLASEKQLLPVYTVEGLEPYALFNLSVTPYTYWGKGPKTSLSLRAPETVPTTPENPRMFVLPSERSLHKNEVVVEFRWDKPKHENGVLTRFEIFYHISNQSDTSRTSKGWIAVNVTSSVTSFQLEAMSPGYIVAFQVRVYTSKGPGPFSDIVKSKASEINSFPYLMSFFHNEIVLLDMDQNQVVWTFLAERDISALGYTADDEMGYFALGDSLFLLNLRNRSSSELFRDARISGSTLITVSWVSRHLYFVLKESHGTQIFDVDLEHKVKRPSELKICNRNSTIVSFSVYPLLRGTFSSLCRRLYWTEVSDVGYQMSYYGTISHTLHHILRPTATDQQNGRVCCSCNVTEFGLSGTMAVDTCDLEKPWIYFAKGQEIWAMDLEGCQCWRVILVPAVWGKAPVSLTVDKDFKYWIITVTDNTQVYQAKKRDRASVSQVKPLRSQCILAYSPATQPLPRQSQHLSPAIPLTSVPGAVQSVNTTVLSGTSVLACHSEEVRCTESRPVTAKMLGTPEKPHATALENISLQLDWKGPPNGNLIRFWFELQKWKYSKFSHVKASCSQGLAYVCNVSGLQPYASCRVRVVVVYTAGERSVSLPEGFQTTAGVPSKPGIPKLLEGSKCSIQWEKAEDDGSGLMYYLLEIRKITSNDSQNQNLRWKMTFNGSCSSICTWKFKNLKGTFQFRVVAVNHLGFGDYSGVSENIILVGDDLWIPDTSFILTTIIGVFLVITILFTFERLEGSSMGEHAELELRLHSTGLAPTTLKRGATDQEKVEFLKEAHLMSKFDHPNILKQLGVCLLNEPQYLILELMEGGYLLTYLRKARLTMFHGPLLTLADLVDLCVDISKGCVYLEQMHFIHRDLAARNCLVSVKDYTSPSRIVKTGDFGLARDIYKNDYYRKRGEGLLPVRWMAPESLMDGIFTTQSDICMLPASHPHPIPVTGVLLSHNAPGHKWHLFTETSVSVAKMFHVNWNSQLFSLASTKMLGNNTD
ncbi:Proto-oncogene tyrosine-protein kinase ROS [Heterocephalus glaber]|uniref:receptor protein-tyrosine kinase n=1 Tax=Heterocephalus glaber TaxID=10181 RepID=G5BBK1_HETGA|nr:Proto-oncogene tyrosine-protein kinase ROS [Heterocephalus glaber]